MHPALTRLDHRPWPIPDRPWIWRQTWHDLLFAHWPVDTRDVRRFVPDWLTIQEFAGSSWAGLVPFEMTGVTLRASPALPWLSRFPEMNLRVYVEYEGKPGIWFVSLDAARKPAVWAARRFTHLPYYLAKMSVLREGDRVRYRSTRADHSGVVFSGAYGPAGPVAEARPGTIDHFLTERYCLYTDGPHGHRYRLEIQHRPWPLQPATAQFDTNTVGAAQGLVLRGDPALLHFSRRLDVVGWGLERVGLLRL